MPWPNDDLATTALDAETDRPPRTMFLRLVQRVQTIIAGRGTANGVCDLDANARVPGARIRRGQANGVASLAAGGRVPDGQIPASVARLSGATFTGRTHGLTRAANDNGTDFATTGFVQQELDNRTLRPVEAYYNQSGLLITTSATGTEVEVSEGVDSYRYLDIVWKKDTNYFTNRVLVAAIPSAKDGSFRFNGDNGGSVMLEVWKPSSTELRFRASSTSRHIFSIVGLRA